MAVSTEFVSEYHKNQQLDGLMICYVDGGTVREKIYGLLRREGWV